MDKQTSRPVRLTRSTLPPKKSAGLKPGTIIPIDPPESHGPLGNRPGCLTRQPEAQPPGERVAASPLLNAPPRSEREIREGRRAKAELDRAFCPSQGGYGILLAFETGSEVIMLATGQQRPGRYVIARDPSYGPLMLACWQDATTGTAHFHRQHRNFWDAMEDIARRGRAGCADFLPGFDR